MLFGRTPWDGPNTEKAWGPSRATLCSQPCPESKGGTFPPRNFAFGTCSRPCRYCVKIGWTWSSVANQEFQGRDANDAVSACFGLRSASGRIQWTQNMPVAFLRASFVASTKLSVVLPFDSADVLGKSAEERLTCCEAFAHRLTFEGLF